MYCWTFTSLIMTVVSTYLQCRLFYLFCVDALSLVSFSGEGGRLGGKKSIAKSHITGGDVPRTPLLQAVAFFLLLPEGMHG